MLKVEGWSMIRRLVDFAALFAGVVEMGWGVARDPELGLASLNMQLLPMVLEKIFFSSLPALTLVPWFFETA